MHKLYKLWHSKPAQSNTATTWPHHQPNTNQSCEKGPLPLGCGHLGINIFGRTDTERIQIMELSAPYPSQTGIFADLYLDINHLEEEVENYTRDLILNDATAHVKYTHNSIIYEREYLASYPDGIIAVKLWASDRGKIAFTLWANALYEGKFKVDTQGGTVETADNNITVKDADTAVILITTGVNNILSEIENTIHAYNNILDRHAADYCKHFNNMPQDMGSHEPCLEELYFHYERYLHIVSSSRGANPPTHGAV